MKIFVALLATVVVCQASPALDGVSSSLVHAALRAKWGAYKATHAKEYHPSEEQSRMSNFLEKTHLIETHNERFAKGLETYAMGHNQFSDMTVSERMSYLGGRLPDPNDNSTVADPAPISATRLGAPASFNWQNQPGILSPIRDQGSCGSCYTFAVTGVLESMYAKRFGQQIDLSEQNLLDCATPANGCPMNGQCAKGGNTGQTFGFAQRFGQMPENIYQYRGVTDGQCYYNQNSVVVRPNSFSWHEVQPARNVAAIREIIYNYGPVAAHVLVDQGLQLYKYGVYQSNTCAQGGGHFVQIVGYGNEGGQDYWVIKNSWDTKWGQGGYGKILAGYNMCNIEAYNLFAQFS